MSFVFSTEKATQAVAVLLKLDPHCQMNYTKLLKLLYIADRESLEETNMPITGDKSVAMNKGPVLSTIYDLIMDRDVDGIKEWACFVEKRGLNVCLLDDPGKSELCSYEIEKLEEVFKRYQDNTQWDLVTLTHEFEEWKRNDPGHSSKPIPIEHIVDAIGKSDDMDEILQTKSEAEEFHRIFAG